MAADEKWYFTKEQLANTPSRRCGIDADKELSYRQQAANFIQDMGQRLVVTQLCINTAIVYMHRFYVFHSLSQFHRNSIAAAALFLAAKVEEQPRKLEHVIKMAYMCLHREQPPDRSEQYLEQAQDLVFNENVLLQTLGFDVAIDHPHTHVVRCCQLVKASKDLAQTSYFMASNSLHLTTMCLQYKPTVVACFCIHLACKWSNWEIPQSNEGRHWFWYVDKSVTTELLAQLTAEFLHIFDKCPSRLKKKIMSISANQSPNLNHQNVPNNNSLFDAEPRKVQSSANAAEGGPTFHFNRPHHSEKQEDKRQQQGPSTNPRPPVDYREYKEKKERERLEREKAAPTPSTSGHQSHAVDINKHHSSHHHKQPVPGTSSMPNKHSVPPGQKSTMHHNHHHRQEIKVNQPVQQRHSTGNQPRESNRDPNRQRIAREYNSSSSSNTNSAVHSHGHILHQGKDVNADNALTDNTSHRSDIATLQDNLSNNNHNLQRLNTMDGKHQPHDKRVYDPRHKQPVDHKKDAEQKVYNKYPDSSRDRQRKSDSLEQRSEEVRKLIEKPLPYPKPALDVQHAANLQKPYHGKYSQADKPQGSTSAFISDIKSTSMPQQNTFNQEKSPTTPASSLSQIPQKSISSKSMISQHSAYGVSQTLKDSIKNGNSQSSCLTPLNNIDDSKAEKRPRHDELVDQQSNLLSAAAAPPPVTKHKSLFSPEKVQTSRESSSSSHSQRPKSKQKTPPAVKVPKQDRAPEAALTGLNLATSFTSPPNLHQAESMAIKRSGSDLSGIGHKRHRTISSSENEPHAKVKIEDASSLEAMKMHSRVPEIIQPIRDNPSSNGRSTSVSSELQPPELIKPFEPETVISRFGTMATNGLDANIETQQVQMEYLSPMKSAQSISALLQEPLAPLPSLLQNMQQFSQITSQQAHQEQQVVQQEQQQQSSQQSQMQLQMQQQQQSVQHQHLHSHQQQQQQQPITSHSLLLPNSQLAVQTQCMTLPSTMTETSVVSTVDISVLSAPVQSNTDGLVQTVPTTTTTVQQPPAVVPTVTEEKKNDHHKSEKKKKKEKHKHKEHKEKSKDKHKHKHKEKDKEKHREKDKDKTEETLPAAPIKITIPKEKLNLSGETAVTSGGNVVVPEKNKSPQGTGLKLKIVKDRLKSTESIPGTQAQPVPQAPLKMKIRTDAIWRSSTGSAPVTTTSASTISSASDYSGESRKRERSDANDSASNALHAAKRPHYHHYHHQQSSQQQQQQHQQQQQQQQVQQQAQQQQQQQSQQVSSMVAGGHGQYRSGERQNGRHYSSSSNNKVRGGGRGGRQYVKGGPPPRSTGNFGVAGKRDGYYQQNTPYNQTSVHHPSKHTSSSNHANTYNRQAAHVVNSCFANFANYPTPSIYTPAAAAAATAVTANTGYMYKHALSYYPSYQQQYSMYPVGNVIMTSDGVIDTTVPPPPFLPPNVRQNSMMVVPSTYQSNVAVQQVQSNDPPPLPAGPPPCSPPPPPPPPPE